MWWAGIGWTEAKNTPLIQPAHPTLSKITTAPPLPAPMHPLLGGARGGFPCTPADGGHPCSSSPLS